MLVALADVQQGRELALERAQVSEAGERVRVGLRLELARAGRHVRLHRLGLDGRGGLHELLDRLGEPHRVVLEVLAQRVQKHRLERRHVTRDIARARLAGAHPERGQRRCPLRLLLRQGVRIAVAVGDRVRDAADQLGQLPSDLLGRELADLVERRTLDQADEPLLGKLVARALEAREGSSNRRHSGRSYLRKRRTAGDISEKIAPVSDLITIDEARRRVLCGRHPPRGRAGSAHARRWAACWPRRCRARSPCRPSTARRWTGSRWWRGRRRSSPWWARRGRGIRIAGVVALGQAVRISTGAVLPEGADAVVPVERTTAVKEAGSGDGVVLEPALRAKGRHDRVSVPETQPGENVRRAGEDIPLNAVVLRTGIAPRARRAGRRGVGRASRAPMRAESPESPSSSPATSSPSPARRSRPVGSTAPTPTPSVPRWSGRVVRW